MGIKDKFKNAIRYVMQWANTDEVKLCCDSPVRKPHRTIDQDNGLNFTIYNATGGLIMQTSRYDRKTDRTISSLYVITDNDKLGDEIEMIITRERLTS